MRQFGAGTALLIVVSLASAADLSNVDRSIARLPPFSSTGQRYCLLVFGPEAGTRVWLVQDGDTLYVDRNGNGDLTESGERVEVKQKEKAYLMFEAGAIADGALSHTDLSVMQMQVDADFVGNAKEYERLKGSASEASYWIVNLQVERPAGDARPLPRRIATVINGDAAGFLRFSDRPETAPVIHLNAPWTLGLQDIKQKLTVGRNSRLQIGVGTPGVGPGTFAFIQYPKTIPNDVYPRAEITFPANSRGTDPIVKKYTLKSRC